MKKSWLLSLVMGSTLALSSSLTLAADEIRIGTEGAYAPFNFVNDDGQLAGFEIDLGNAVCAHLKAKCQFVANEWDSIIPNLIAGNYDVIMAGMSITDERKKTIAFSEDYKPVDPSLYIAPADSKLDFENLEGKSIGVQGATIQAAFATETYGEKNTIKSYEKGDQSIADLMAGNLDLVFADGEFLLPVVKGSEGAIAVVGPEEKIGGGIGAGMRQKDTELHDKINGALQALKKEGTLDKLIAKYFDGAGPFYSEAE